MDGQASTTAVTERGLKQTQITKCAKCGRGVCHDHNIAFMRVRTTRFIVDVRAVQRQHGLEQMLGGAARLANVMGPDEDLAKAVHNEETRILCDDCAMKTTVFDAASLEESA